MGLPMGDRSGDHPRRGVLCGPVRHRRARVPGMGVVGAVMVPKRLRKLLNGLRKPLPTPDQRTYVTDADWDRSYRYFPGELTEQVIKADQPDWTPPPAAKRDPWRPMNSLSTATEDKDDLT